ncbi:MAG: Cna B-type domain-containing protein, partial [Solobacterium sp.]|nr:Cna B-type domain-containing protein [Solobacterium sp.]
VSITRTVTTGWDAEKKVYVTTTAYQINGGQSEMDLTDEKADTSKVAAVIISGTKTVNGLNDLSSVAGLFRFELLNSDNDNKVIDTAKNNAQGKFSFAKITYDTAGDYHYTVREINGGRVINGFRYSNQSYQVTVHVGDEDKDGVLAANISNIQNENNEAVSEIEFRNTALRSLHVAKIWDDNHNTAGMRPKSIQVQLFEDEKLVDGSTATLSAETGWSHDYVGLDKTKNYTVKEVMPDDSGYTPSQAVSADGNTVYLINTFTVNLSAHKTLKGALIQNGEFTFKLVRNSDPANAYYAVNDGSGNIYFNNIPYDDEGYTVTEVSENGDPHITYDADAITYDKDGKITSSKTEFVNTERPAVLRVQKTSKEEPHDPLVGAVYGLYMAGADGTNDVLVEAQTSDANGYMYYTKFQEGVWYYFKEISAPAGHEVDPYPGQKFEIKYQADGSLTMVDKDGKVISTADITDSISTETAAYVQINTAQTDLNSITADAGHVKLTSDSDGVKAVAVAVAGALPEDTQLQVEKVNLSKTAEENLKKQVGAVKSVAYYDVSFISNGEKVEPEAGTVTVTIQEDNGTAIPSDVNPSNLKLVHLLDDEAKGVAPVYGSIEVDGNTMHGASVTSSSFSIFGVVEPEDMTAFGSNYLLTASGVSDKVSKVQIAKLDTAGKYVIGADLQIIEKKTGKVVAEWKTSEGNKVFNRFFSEDEPLNVDTDYVLHEVSAPEGYQKADDIVFRLNKYDSSLSIWRYDEKGSLVEDTKSADEAVTDFTLTMTDKPIKVEKDKVYKQKTIHKDTVLYKNNEVTETITTTDKKGNKVTVTRYGTNTVNTGVANHTALYVTLIVIAAAAVIVITVLKNRKGKEAE